MESEEGTENSLSQKTVEETGGPWTKTRLSRNVVPKEYFLHIDPDLSRGTFDGTVVINIKVKYPTFYIILHQSNLDIKTTKLLLNSKEIPIESTFAYPENQFWVIKLISELSEGDYELMMKFSGQLGSGTLGLYKSTFTDEDGEELPCMLSYFEATYARCAFPCFDEPSFRAKFAVKISYVVNEKVTALSNMCRDKETLNYPRKGVNTVHFKVSPPMPPYLVALIVGKFNYTEPVVSKCNTSVAVYSRPEISNAMIKARDIAVAVVNFFSEYFDFPFPLLKLDLIALPNSNIGGMENWGMITFREDVLILNENSTCDDYLRVVDIISHEISHMWFGDLVCIEWWDNLWLKEGFATYMACVAGNELHPEWHHEWVVLRSMLSALQMDAALESHPIVQKVNTTAEIREVFDAISYEKGCCLIRMLQDLNPEGFQLGVKSYLKKYKYSSAVTQNLWDEIQEKVDFEVSFIDTWTHQMGYPVISVEKCVGDRMIISQSRFLLNKYFIYNQNSSPFKYRWDIPIKYVSSDDPGNVKLIWLKKDQQSAMLDVSPNVSWIKMNWHQIGIYRVNYHLSQWDDFSIQLVRNPLVFDVEDRVSLIDDAFNLACAGYFYYHVPLNLLRYFKYGMEKHFFPWAVASNYLRFIAARLYGTDCHQLFMKYVQLLLKGNLSDDLLDFGDQKKFLEKKLQLELIKLACWAEDTEILTNVRTLFSDWLNEQKPLDVELSQIVYSYGLSYEVTQEEWDLVLNRCINERNVKEKLNLWCSLGNVKNSEYLKQLIDLAKDGNNLKSQDFFLLLRSIVKHNVGLSVVWDFIRNEWPYLVERFTLEDMGLCGIVFQVCSQFGTTERLNETMEFFKTTPDLQRGCFIRLYIKILECIRINQDWRPLFLDNIKYWLQEYLATEWFSVQSESEDQDLLDASLESESEFEIEKEEAEEEIPFSQIEDEAYFEYGEEVSLELNEDDI